MLFSNQDVKAVVKLPGRVLDSSNSYAKALAEENKNPVDVENGASIARYAYLKRTAAVHLDDILQGLEAGEQSRLYVVKGSATNTTTALMGI